MTRWIWVMAAMLLAACSQSSTQQTVAVDAAASSEDPSTARAQQAEPLRIEVWHDLVCPWCRIGLHNLETALSEFDDAPVEVVHRAYILDPSVPSEGVDMAESMARKMGSADRVQAAHARVAQAGAQYGLTFDFASQKVMPQTAHTHAVIAWAPAEKRRALIGAIHDAHFLEGRNIGDAATLGELAASVGLDGEAARAAATDPARLEAVRAEARTSRPAGVRGVPHFVIGDQVLRGAQPPQALREAMEKAAAARTSEG